VKAVLLMAHGSPESLSDEDMHAYLLRVRGGRPPTPQLIQEMQAHYGAIGGSPLKSITLAQARALEQALGDGTLVHVGMRNSLPTIADALAEAAGHGASEVVALPLAPQYSALSVGKYQKAVQESRPESMRVRFVSSWHDHAGLLEAFAEKARAAMARDEPDAVVFTAHSLPARLAQEGDPYVGEVTATAQGVASRVGLDAFRLAWQSAGRTQEPWLTPSLEQMLGELSGQGVSRVLVVPVGFVSDHTEILYDIDVEAAGLARQKDLRLTRSESLNTSPAFIAALADIVHAQRD
jgi:ferrochelatase